MHIFSGNVTYNRIGEELVDFSTIDIPFSTEHVDLSFNKFVNIPSPLFTNHPNIKHLDLFSCRIQIIENNAFSSLTSLLILHLHSNEIQSINQFTFRGLVVLQELSLSENLINTIMVGSFSDLAVLQHLYVNNNNLKTLDEGIFHLVHHPIDLHFDVTGNTMECDCRLLWVLEAEGDWLSMTNAASVRCSGPTDLAGRNFQSLDEQSLTSTHCPLFGRYLIDYIDLPTIGLLL